MRLILFVFYVSYKFTEKEQPYIQMFMQKDIL
jgi:hypothetical protein